MHEILIKLQNDHKNIALLLRLLKQQTDSLEKGEYFNMQLLTDILRYFVNYPGIHHHSHENLIFSALEKKPTAQKELISRIHKQHEKIEQDSQQLFDQLLQIQGNAIFSREKLVSQLQNYMHEYNDHIDIEEQMLFPLTDKLFDNEDWREISSKISLDNVQVFNRILENEYIDLYRSILSETSPQEN